MDSSSLVESRAVHEGEAHFQMEDGEGKPSQWNTLRAMRVLDWYALRAE